ncbi:MAG TPA: apolipoprotein N-acyltransferase [Candidatus Omnitrophota bacterium]|jgi:apolipoprotein N-acyltransferase|nr:MAG: Apolipoprotein N-acyltransferase [Candidatus Omnitrophica bacterium ADurb.Bin314]HOE68046.1 apolipoprotein N-acyltransferase [Candidatus Omnitrophota bacterium]HQB94182.1 apolipoprotein N-acyltransferase [Candidatus Omnitrophota bacterium]
MKKVRFLLAIVSGILLALSFPHPGWGWIAWVALIPLFYAIRSAQSGLSAFGLGYLAGFVFFSVSMQWMTHVTAVGWLLLAILESFFIGVFAYLVYLGKQTSWPVFCKVLWTASAWTLTEYARSEVPVFGLGWNLLAYSQASCPVMIQIANAGGAYGLGFLIAVVNVSLAKLCLFEKKRKRGVTAGLFASALLVLFGTYAYGEWQLAEAKPAEEFLRVTVLQGNIPQSLKWAPVAREKIIEVYSKLTELASLSQSDLAVWPEASFPGYFNRDLLAEVVKRRIRELGVPVLLGGLHWESREEVYNSAYFVDRNGETGQRYDKLNLVPFGEYIPLKRIFFWLTPIADALGISDFSMGKDAVLFRWAREAWPFGTLICFEDVVPSLAREFAARGATFLAVITNDAWFLDTGAPFQHLQASIFRAVENGIPVVRSANTGVSGFITHRGEVSKTVTGNNGKETFVTGLTTHDIPLISRITWYRRGGWMFPHATLIVFMVLSVVMWRRRSHG